MNKRSQGGWENGIYINIMSCVDFELHTKLTLAHSLDLKIDADFTFRLNTRISEECHANVFN